MIKTTDYLVKWLEDFGIKHVFMVSGGGAMHLNDSFGKSENIEYICNHHEQACAIAAEGYARATNKLAVVNVTTGPGGTNALTGLIGSYYDSVPVLFVSGQVKYETTIHACPELDLRQLGDQEANIIEMVKPVTKYAVMIKDPAEIKYHLEKAVTLATTGRPGPVWIDIPLDVQGAMVDEGSLRSYDKEDKQSLHSDTLEEQVMSALQRIKQAKRPVIVAGRGVRVSNARDLLLEWSKKTNIPVVSTFNGMDLIPTNHTQFKGRIGTIGNRPGNFVLQNADLILCIGTRNNIRQISYNFGVFGREAYKIIVDIDPAELKKPTIKPDLPIVADAADFLTRLDGQTAQEKLPDWSWWNHWCDERVAKYPAVLPEYYLKDKIDPYVFTKVLTEKLEHGDTMVSANATPSITLFQTGIVKENQRVIMNSGAASMGYDLPAAIGACIATERGRTICLAGEGSMMMNLQELQTIVHYQLPIKIFVFNNNGYVSIQQTQENFFQGRYVASNNSSGVTFPNLLRVAEAFGLKVYEATNHSDMGKAIDDTLACEGPVVCNVELDSYKFAPKLSSERKPDGRLVSKPLEDMFPFLDREEFRSNMIVPLYSED